MIEDMTVRGFTASTQRGYLAAITAFAVFLGRSPDRADALVWAMSELMLGRLGEARVRGM